MANADLTPEGVRALIAELEKHAALGMKGTYCAELFPRAAAALSASLPREDADLDALAAKAFPLDGATPALVFAFREVFAKGYAAALASRTVETAEEWEYETGRAYGGGGFRRRVTAWEPDPPTPETEESNHA